MIGFIRLGGNYCIQVYDLKVFTAASSSNHGFALEPGLHTWPLIDQSFLGLSYDIDDCVAPPALSEDVG